MSSGNRSMFSAGTGGRVFRHAEVSPMAQGFCQQLPPERCGPINYCRRQVKKCCWQEFLSWQKRYFYFPNAIMQDGYWQ